MNHSRQTIGQLQAEYNQKNSVHAQLLTLRVLLDSLKLSVDHASVGALSSIVETNIEQENIAQCMMVLRQFSNDDANLRAVYRATLARLLVIYAQDLNLLQDAISSHKEINLTTMICLQSEYNEILLDMLWLMNPHERSHKITIDHLEMLVLKYHIIPDTRQNNVHLQEALLRSMVLLLQEKNYKLLTVLTPE